MLGASYFGPSYFGDSYFGTGGAAVLEYEGAYADEHAGALADIMAAGFPVTFDTGTPGEYDPTSGLFDDPEDGEVVGFALRKQPSASDLERFRLRGLAEDKTVLLLFVATTYGETPTLGATVEWEGETLTVRDLKPLAPDGVVIKTDVAASR